MNNNGKPRRKRLKKWIVRIILLLLVCAIGWYAYTSLKKEYTINYNEYTAKIGSISNSMSFSGNLSLIDTENYTSKASTSVRSVYVAAGDTVKANDKIMRLTNGEVIRAGISGTVNAVNYKVGEDVPAGEILAQVADFTHMKASFRVDEYDINNVHVGQECLMTVTALERQFSTSVAEINHISASTGNVAYYTAAAYVDVNEGVYPGMQITITIPQESAENVVILKADALSFDRTNSAFVYMRGADGTSFEKVPVEIGVSNGNYIEIKSGLNDGDVVYVEAKAEETSSGGLLSGLFGGTNISAPGQTRMSGNYRGTGAGGWNGGNMPPNAGGFGNGSFGGSNSGRQ